MTERLSKREWWERVKARKPELAEQIREWPEFGEVLYEFQGMVVDAKVIKNDDNSVGRK